MHLVPGLWLDASTWDRVVPLLEAAGHTAHPLTLPGMASREADRSAITAQDHVDAVVAAIDALDPAAGPVVLVGHSVGGALAHAATDARPERVARTVFVASEPRGDGEPTADGLPEVDGEVPLPDWSSFDDEELPGLDDALRTELRAKAVPAPLRVTRDPLHLSDERRYDVPATVITCEYPAAMLQQWVAEGHPYDAELGRLRDVTYVDLATATGHSSPGPKSSPARSSAPSAGRDGEPLRVPDPRAGRESP